MLFTDIVVLLSRPKEIRSRNRKYIITLPKKYVHIGMKYFVYFYCDWHIRVVLLGMVNSLFWYSNFMSTFGFVLSWNGNGMVILYIPIHGFCLIKSFTAPHDLLTILIQFFPVFFVYLLRYLRSRVCYCIFAVEWTHEFVCSLIGNLWPRPTTGSSCLQADCLMENPRDSIHKGV